jgi:hypothetical protein
MNTTPPIGGLVAGTMLAADNLTLVVVTMALVVAVPGAIGLVHPALGRAATADQPAITPPIVRMGGR